MVQASPQPESIENRVTRLERDMSDLRTAAEALLQTAQIHQQNFETVTAEFQSFRQRQQESDQRFEIMLVELRQLKIESDARFNGLQTEINGLQTEIRRILDRLFNSQRDD
jgi:chromosome segregation ATPase